MKVSIHSYEVVAFLDDILLLIFALIVGFYCLVIQIPYSYKRFSILIAKQSCIKGGSHKARNLNSYLYFFPPTRYLPEPVDACRGGGGVAGVYFRELEHILKKVLDILDFHV